MASVIWTLQSLQDIERIAAYISTDSPKSAQLQVKLFFKAVKILESFPKIGFIVPEADATNIREIIVGSFRIIYQITSKENVDVLTVHHSYRLLTKKQIYSRRKR